MLDPPVDAWYLWVGLAVVAAAATGAASQLPTTPAPDARAAAGTVDRVAAAGHAATARHPIDADAVRLDPHQLALRDDGRTIRADFTSRVTPVRRGTALWRVLRGGRPGDQFADPPALRDAVRTARNRSARWRPADRLYVPRVTWDGFRVTLVGA